MHTLPNFLWLFWVCLASEYHLAQMSSSKFPSHRYPDSANGFEAPYHQRSFLLRAVLQVHQAMKFCYFVSDHPAFPIRRVGISKESFQTTDFKNWHHNCFSQLLIQGTIGSRYFWNLLYWSLQLKGNRWKDNMFWTNPPPPLSYWRSTRSTQPLQLYSR